MAAETMTNLHDHELEGALIVSAVNTPEQSRALVPLSAEARAVVRHNRREVAGIIRGEDPRLLVVLGPCSMNFTLNQETQSTAQMLAVLQDQLPGLKLMMRLPGEKPRSGNKATDWAGAITDPDMDGSNRQNQGIMQARLTYNAIMSTGIPVATEQLDPALWPHIRDQISFGWLGSRNVQNNAQWRHISAEPMAFGIKNGTDGDMKTVLGAMRTAASPQVFLGRDLHGKDVMMSSRGNQNLVPIMRGSEQTPNFGLEHTSSMVARLAEDSLLGANKPGVVIDCAHGNCLVDGKKSTQRQVEVFRDLTAQIAAGDGDHIRGIMMETFINTKSATDPVVVLSEVVSDLHLLNAAVVRTRGK